MQSEKRRGVTIAIQSFSDTTFQRSVFSVLRLTADRGRSIGRLT
jgi:hypothetical protein